MTSPSKLAPRPGAATPSGYRPRERRPDSRVHFSCRMCYGRAAAGVRGPPEAVLSGVPARHIVRRVDMDEYRRASHAIWEAMAPGWDARHEYLELATRPVTERI